MPYVPQFVQTDLSALQGIMDRSQAKYDYNTQRQDQLTDTIASMSANDPFEQQQKESIRKDLTETLKNLDKKYNYDRSSGQYAKELSTELANKKALPYFSYKAQADKLAADRAKAKLDMKGDYFEGRDPFATTPDNMTLEARTKSLHEWQPLSLKEVELAAAQKGAALAKEFNSYEKMNDPRFAGWYLAMQQTGQPTLEAAYEVLDKNPELINEAIAGTAFAQYAEDPNIKQRVREAMAKQMVGETKIDPLANPFERPAAAGKTVKPNYDTFIGLGLTDPSGQGGYDIKTADEYRDFSKEVSAKQAELDAFTKEYDTYDTEKKAAYAGKKAELEADVFLKRVALTKAKTVLDDIEYNTAEGIAAREQGVKLIKQNAPVAGLSDAKAEEYYDRLKEAFVYSSKWQRSLAGQGSTLLVDAVTNIVPAYLDEAGAMRAAEKGMAAIPALKEEAITERDKALANVKDAATRNAIFEAYAVWGEMLDKAQKDKLFKDKPATIEFLKQSRKMFSEFADFYEGNGAYAYSGPDGTNALPSYKAVEEMQDEKLKNGIGELYKEQVTHPYYDATKKKQLAVHLAENFDRWDLLDQQYVKGEGESWKTLKSPLQAKLLDGAKEGKVKFTFHTNPDAPVIMQLTHDDGTSGLFKMDPDKVGTEELLTLASIVPNEEIRQSIYAAMFSHVQFPRGGPEADTDLSQDNAASRAMQKVLGTKLMDQITNGRKDPLLVRQGKIKDENGNTVNGYILTDVTTDKDGNQSTKVFTYQNRVDLTFALAKLAGIPEYVRSITPPPEEAEEKPTSPEDVTFE